MNEALVYVYKTSPHTLDADIKKVLATKDFQKLDSRKRTFIKINANYDRDWPGCNTSRWFLEALLKGLREEGFDNLTVIEGDLKLQPAIRTIKAIGIDKILEKHDVPFLPIESLPRDANELPAILKEVQLISTPVLHTHTFAVISCAAKNLYGLLPIYREKYHSILSEKLLELVANTNVFTIVDGTVGLEGGSMRLGSRRRTDLILAGWNPIAIDIVASRTMGFVPEQIPYLNLAYRNGLTNSFVATGDFDLDSLPEYDFAWKDSKLSTVDLWLRGNRATAKLFKYNSPFDRFQNRARRIYTSLVYNVKKKRILEGDWKEYEEVNTSSGK